MVCYLCVKELLQHHFERSLKATFLPRTTYPPISQDVLIYLASSMSTYFVDLLTEFIVMLVLSSTWMHYCPLCVITLKQTKIRQLIQAFWFDTYKGAGKGIVRFIVTRLLTEALIILMGIAESKVYVNKIVF